MNDNNITFTVTAFNKTVTITQPEDINIHEFLDTCRSLAIALEYQHESWEDAVITMAEDIKFAYDRDMIDEYEEDQTYSVKYPDTVVVSRGEEYVIVDGVKYIKPQEC